MTKPYKMMSMKFHVINHKNANICGFAAKDIKVGENISVVVSNVCTSDDENFCKCVDQVFNCFIGEHGILPAEVSNFPQ